MNRENVLRAAMHGRHLPILAALPYDMKWYQTNVSYIQIGQLKTLNERSWNLYEDGATSRCATVAENYQNIHRQHCGSRTKGKNTKANQYKNEKGANVGVYNGKHTCSFLYLFLYSFISFQL
tara:strand:+ start:109 stop:474 length:366 start_codon:yes stop_codon:yes gene_type:complete